MSLSKTFGMFIQTFFRNVKTFWSVFVRFIFLNDSCFQRPLIDRFWPLLDCFWSLLAALGPLLGALGPLLGRSWPLLGRSWPLLGRSWPLLGGSWPLLERHSKINEKSIEKCVCMCVRGCVCVCVCEPPFWHPNRTKKRAKIDVKNRCQK